MNRNQTLLLAFAAITMVALNAWAGQFKKAAYYRSGMRPSQVVTGDFNNDGNADLAFADWLSNQLVVLLGNGDGTFQKPLIIRAPSPTSLAAGDLDGDGNLDLVVAESGGQRFWDISGLSWGWEREISSRGDVRLGCILWSSDRGRLQRRRTLGRCSRRRG
jgi:hypothetical protein